MQRIVDGQKQNDTERQVLMSSSIRLCRLTTSSFSTKPKGVRLGYMGHLTLMAEDVITALEHFPLDLRHIIERFAPQPAWNDYVTGRYKETKKRDTSLLGGGKPAVTNAPRAGGRWAVDEEDVKTTAVPANGGPGVKGEFKRTTTTRPSRETSADFGPAPMEDEEDHGTGPPQVLYNLLVWTSSLYPRSSFSLHVT